MIGARNEFTIKKLLSMRRLDLRTCIDIYKGEDATMNQLQYLTEHTTTNELYVLTHSSRITCNFRGLRHEKCK